MNRIILIVILSVILPGCATNEHDAAIAESAASIERTKEDSYAKGIAAANQPKLLVEIKGEVVCTEDQKLSDNCGISFYNPNARSVMPQRDKNWVDGVIAVGDTLVRGVEALTPVVLAKEVTNIVEAVGDSAGGNVSNVGSGNTHTEQNTLITKTATGDLLDGTSSKDLSNNSVITNTESVGNDKIIGNSDRINNSINDSQNPITTDSNDNNSTVTEVVPTTTAPEEGSN